MKPWTSGAFSRIRDEITVITRLLSALWKTTNLENAVWRNAIYKTLKLFGRVDDINTNALS